MTDPVPPSDAVASSASAFPPVGDLVTQPKPRSTLLGRPMEHFGNRPIDVCALCDRPITKPDHGYGGLHIYVGPGVAHGGARENIPCHVVCLALGDDRYDDQREGWTYHETPAYEAQVAYYRRHFLSNHGPGCILCAEGRTPADHALGDS